MFICAAPPYLSQFNTNFDVFPTPLPPAGLAKTVNLDVYLCLVRFVVQGFEETAFTMPFLPENNVFQ
jgi:hypothetical protein